MKAKFCSDHSWHCCVFSKNLLLGFTKWLKHNHVAKRTLNLTEAVKLFTRKKEKVW